MHLSVHKLSVYMDEKRCGKLKNRGGQMQSIRTKYTLLTICAIVVALGFATFIGVTCIRKLGNDDADQILSLMCKTGSMNLEAYIESVEHSTQTVASIVQSDMEDMTIDQLGDRVEQSREVFSEVAENTHGVLTYYYRIDPEASEDVEGYWYVKQAGKGFVEHEVTDITQYDTNDTSRLVWFTVPKATGEGAWLPPYHTENLGAKVISYNVPIYWKKQFIGVIGIEIGWDTLAHEVENIRLFDSGYAFLLDADSNIIYHPDMEDEQETISVPEGLLGADDPVIYNYKGVEKKAYWLPLSNDMRLYVSVPLSEINKSWHDMVLYILLASLIILLIVSVLITRLTSHLTKPLRELAETARQVDPGDSGSGIKNDGKDEVSILKGSLERLDYKASHDELTGLYDRSGYELLLSNIDLGSTYMILMDIDGFKSINDTYGHEVGDKVLVRLARVLESSFRSEDYICRIGGDEFVVFMMHTSKKQRAMVGTKIKEINMRMMRSSDGVPPATVSAGITHGSDASDTAEMFTKADAAMYEAKQSGKQTFRFSDR